MAKRTKKRNKRVSKKRVSRKKYTKKNKRKYTKKYGNTRRKIRKNKMRGGGKRYQAVAEGQDPFHYDKIVNKQIDDAISRIIRGDTKTIDIGGRRTITITNNFGTMVIKQVHLDTGNTRDVVEIVGQASGPPPVPHFTPPAARVQPKQLTREQEEEERQVAAAIAASLAPGTAAGAEKADDPDLAAGMAASLASMPKPDELPDGWEERFEGTTPYYVNHNTKTTTWEKPSAPVMPAPVMPAPVSLGPDVEVWLTSFINDIGDSLVWNEIKKSMKEKQYDNMYTVNMVLARDGGVDLVIDDIFPPEKIAAWQTYNDYRVRLQRELGVLKGIIDAAAAAQQQQALVDMMAKQNRAQQQAQQAQQVVAAGGYPTGGYVPPPSPGAAGGAPAPAPQTITLSNQVTTWNGDGSYKRDIPAQTTITIYYGGQNERKMNIKRKSGAQTVQVYKVNHGSDWSWVSEFDLTQAGAAAVGAAAGGAPGPAGGAAAAGGPPGTHKILFYRKPADGGKLYKFTNFFYRDPSRPLFSGNHSGPDTTTVWKTPEHYFQVYKFLQTAAADIQTLYSQASNLPTGNNGLNAMGPEWGTETAKKHPVNNQYWHGNGSDDTMTPGKDRAMYNAVKMKFTQNPDLHKLLVDTGDALIIENAGLKVAGVSPGDKYWGDGKYGDTAAGTSSWDFTKIDDKEGKNKLGLLLMEIRDELTGGTTLAHFPQAHIQKDKSYDHSIGYFNLQIG